MISESAECGVCGAPLWLNGACPSCRGRVCGAVMTDTRIACGRPHGHDGRHTGTSKDAGGRSIAVYRWVTPQEGTRPMPNPEHLRRCAICGFAHIDHIRGAVPEGCCAQFVEFRLTNALNVAGVPAMPSLQAAIDYLVRERDEARAENERLREVVEHYAADSNWINGQEYKTFPGFHAAAVARAALDAVASTTGEENER